MNPEIVLTVLETAGLVRPVATTPEAEYAFRHGLLQDTAYGLLLKGERERLHREVGVALEECYPKRTDELAALLGNHFLLGDDQPRALQYLRAAGMQARRHYANAEALEDYSTALELARELQRPLDEADLRRERGLTHEIVGNFEEARADHEAALALGRELDERVTEWRALLDLGKLWAAQDYAKTGEYFRKALEVARAIDDKRAVGRSLNRLGNWHINSGNPDQAKRHHQEALEIFEELGDQEGIAETLDFLGMASMISSDVRAGASYYERAIYLLRSIGDKQRLASALTSYALRIGSTQTETTVGVNRGGEEALVNFEEALELARELGWKSGESFSLWTLAFLLSSLGRLGEALERGQLALKVAQDIEHTQWMTASCCVLGRTHLEMLDDESAVEYSERSRRLAQSIGSRHWMGISTGLTGLAYVTKDEPERAKDVLQEFSDPKPGMVMLGDRLYWNARAEMLLAFERFEEALELLDELIERAPGYSGKEVIARLSHGRGLGYMGAGKMKEARGELEASLEQAKRQQWRTMLWKVHRDLARLEDCEGNQQAAEEQLAAGREIISEVADSIPDEAQRRQFMERGQAQLSI